MSITQRVHSGQPVPTDVEVDRPPLRSLRRAFALLWASLSVVLLILSVQTVRASLSGGGVTDSVGLAIGGLEAIAAILFLAPRTMRIGASGLIATLLATVAVQATRGAFAGQEVILVAAVFFVMTHGPILPGDLRPPGRDRRSA